MWDAFKQRFVGADDNEEDDDALEEAEEEASTEWVPAKARRLAAAERVLAKRQRASDTKEIEVESSEADAQQPSLLVEAAALKALDQGESHNKRDAEEEWMLREASRVQTNALQTAKEISMDRKWTESLKTSWRPSEKARRTTDDQAQTIRKKWCILVSGEDVPHPIKAFGDMGLPDALVQALAAKKIKRPTPIQVQGMPVALAGRDLIGIAFTGSGKTLTFSLPLIVRALEREREDGPYGPGDGPTGLILCPSRELARQTYQVVSDFVSAVNTDIGAEHIRATCAIGGEDKRSQLEPIRRRGVHVMVATPGRLIDFLVRGSCSLKKCCYLCLDEGDRMLDLGFDEEVKRIINHFDQQRQTLLFSATFPQKFQDFARETLVRPVVVNVSRAGAANLDVIQEVEYVKLEARIVYLLECLQKTAPPVVIFCERKQDVDDIHEYLLLKGIEAVSIHGGKDQAERNEAIDLFKHGKKDVLVATDVAAKGLDFPDIKHVINFDMPSEIENYIHRIGRTGRCGKTGVATTFINKSVSPTALLDLRKLLVEAKQRVPPVLQVLQDDDPQQGCAYCGGLGHRISDCPKRDKDARRLNAERRDMISGSGGYGGDW